MRLIWKERECQARTRKTEQEEKQWGRGNKRETTRRAPTHRYSFHLPIWHSSWHSRATKLSQHWWKRQRPRAPDQPWDISNCLSMCWKLADFYRNIDARCRKVCHCRRDSDRRWACPGWWKRAKLAIRRQRKWELVHRARNVSSTRNIAFSTSPNSENRNGRVAAQSTSLPDSCKVPNCDLYAAQRDPHACCTCGCSRTAPRRCWHTRESQSTAMSSATSWGAIIINRARSQSTSEGRHRKQHWESTKTQRYAVRASKLLKKTEAIIWRRLGSGQVV